MNTGIVTQVRMGSTRLPGKVMKFVENRPMLDIHLDRLQQVDRPLYVATTRKSQDDVIVDHCRGRNIPTFRGSETDVLKRYRDTARHFDLDNVVRVTSDCPLLDPDLIREGIHTFERESWDFLANNHPERTFPHGMDYAIFSRDLLEEAERRANIPEYREHVPTFMQDQDKYRKKSITSEQDDSHIRLTVDYPGDLEVIRILVREYDVEIKGYRDIVDCYREAFF